MNLLQSYRLQIEQLSKNVRYMHSMGNINARFIKFNLKALFWHEKTSTCHQL